MDYVLVPMDDFIALKRFVDNTLTASRAPGHMDEVMDTSFVKTLDVDEVDILNALSALDFLSLRMRSYDTTEIS
jgi:hypothetical protein